MNWPSRESYSVMIWRFYVVKGTGLLCGQLTARSWRD
jgi:hypothetical protein